jgi:hypothetical protein
MDPLIRRLMETDGKVPGSQRPLPVLKHPRGSLLSSLTWASPLSTMDSFSTPVVCLYCREKHLKCDGDQNGCARCMSLSQPCYFVPSRQGRKTRPEPLPSIQVDAEGVDSPFAVPNVNMLSTFDIEEFAQSQLNLVAPFAPQQHANSHLISLYYSHFHESHPFLPPMPAFLQTTPQDTCLKS